MNGTNQAPLSGNPSKERDFAREKEIVSAAQAGSSGAFAELYALHSRQLYRTIMAITRNAEDAKDVLQDTFLRAYLAIHTFEGRSTVYSWLTRIAINSALMLLRKRNAHFEVLFGSDAATELLCFEIKDPAPTPEQLCDLRHRCIKLIREIHRLDAGLRRPIQMRVSAELSTKEIGQVLNISEAAVKTRLHRARRRLSAACQES